MVLIAIMGAWLAVGVVVLARGLRRRVIDDHPVCIGCGYDLVGMRERMPERCPECGAGLAEEGRVRAGNVRRRPRRVWAGAVVLGMWALVMAPMVGGALGGAKWVKAQPTWLLMLQAEWRDGRGVAPVVEELLNRQGGGLSGGGVPLSVGEQEALAKRAMSISLRPCEPGTEPAGWDPVWGDVLFDSAIFGRLSAKEQEEAMRMGVAATLESRRRVQIEGGAVAVPIRLKAQFDRRFLFPAGRELACEDVRLLVTDEIGREVARGSGELRFICWPVVVQSGAGWVGKEVVVALESVGGGVAKPGTYRLEIDGNAVLRGRRSGPGQGLATTGVTEMSIPLRLSTSLEVAATGDSSVGVVEAPELAAVMQKKLSVGPRASPYGGGRWSVVVGIGMAGSMGERDQEGEALSREMAKRGISGVYRILLTGADGVERAAGRAVLEPIANGRFMLAPAGETWDDVRPGRYRVRMVPDWAYAQTRIECERILGGELVFEGVEMSVNE